MTGDVAGRTMTLRVGDLRLAYSENGRGRPLVMVHGNFASRLEGLP